MAGKKSAKGGDPEVVPALTETIVTAVENPKAAFAAVEDPAEAVSEAADPQEQEVPEEETAEESGAKETPAAEAAAVPGSEALEAGSQDIFSDGHQLEVNLPEEEMESPLAEEPAAGPEEIREGESREDECQGTVQGKKLFKITCRNKVSEVIGGVMFVAGVGYTRDAYAASWFANKAGYRVDREG